MSVKVASSNVSEKDCLPAQVIWNRFSFSNFLNTAVILNQRCDHTALARRLLPTSLDLDELIAD